MSDAPTPISRLLSALSPRNVSAVYLFVVLFAIFSIVVPETFLSVGVWRSIADTQALFAIVAIAVVIPLAAGVFNLAIGAEVGFASIIVAVLVGQQGWSPTAAIVAALAAGCLIGAATGLLVVRLNIDSLIATLGTSSVLVAITAWVSDSQQVLGLSTSFQEIATTRVLGVTSSTLIMLAVAATVWYVLELTTIGRRVYATGGNRQAARLAGVNTSMVVVASLAACGLIAAVAGVLQSARTGAGDPTVGAGFLLPAYAAAMLGSTQLRGGRYNVWGAVLGVYVLATGIKGLQLAGAPVWIPEFFNGLAVLVAVGIAARQRRLKTTRRPMAPSSPVPDATRAPHPSRGDLDSIESAGTR